MKRALKWILGIVGGLVALVLLVPALLPSAVHVERSAVINKPPENVYAYISDLNNFKQWNPFIEGDPTVQTQVTGSGVGTVYSWKGDEQKTGAGQMTIAALDPNKKVDLDMEMFAPMAARFKASYILAPTDGGTQMTWTYDGENGYFGRYFGLMMDGMLGPMFEKGMSNLKGQLEK